MKRVFIIGTVLLLCIAYGACKKVPGPANGKSIQLNNSLDPNVYMSAAINGVDWSTDSAFGYTIKNSANDSSKINLMINGVNNDANGNPSTITFNIYNYTGPAMYHMNAPLVTATYYIGTTRHFATYGYVHITSDTNYALIADFYFAADSFSVAGTFNVAMP